MFRSDVWSMWWCMNSAIFWFRIILHGSISVWRLFCLTGMPEEMKSVSMKVL